MFGGNFIASCSEAFSLVLVRLMMPLMTSFCFLLVSLLLHQLGRLYSHSSPRFLHALQRGFSSEHFFRLNRHVKHPDLDLLCIFELFGDVSLPDVCVCCCCSAACAMLLAGMDSICSVYRAKSL